MTDPVLLESLGVDNGDLHMPHAGDGIQGPLRPPRNLGEAATSNTAYRTEGGVQPRSESASSSMP